MKIFKKKIIKNKKIKNQQYFLWEWTNGGD